MNNPTNLTDPLGLNFAWQRTLVDDPLKSFGLAGVFLGVTMAATGYNSETGLYTVVGVTQIWGYSGPRGRGGGCTDSRMGYIDQLRNQLYDSLVNDPDCLTFLAGMGANVLETLQDLPISIDYARVPGGRAVVADTQVFHTLDQIAPVSANTVVNRLGEFFNSTPRFQATTLLHELGHATGVLPPDSGVPVNQNNTESIQEHCKKTLSGFKN